MARFIVAPDDKARVDQALQATDSAIIILLTGISLVVSGIIQANLYGLTVYHGLILLALSWLTVIAAIPPYMTITANILSEGETPKLYVSYNTNHFTITSDRHDS